MEVDMAVQLNIKDPETVRLARALADRSGKSITETVRAALETAQHAREAETAARIAEVQRIVRSVREKLTPEMRTVTSKEAMDSIYVDGLPE